MCMFYYYHHVKVLTIILKVSPTLRYFHQDLNLDENIIKRKSVLINKLEKNGESKFLKLASTVEKTEKVINYITINLFWK